VNSLSQTYARSWKRGSRAGVDAALIKRLLLSSITEASVKSLSGFSKTSKHFVPKYVGGATDEFISRIAADDVAEVVDTVARVSRTSLGLKRVHLDSSAEGGSGTVITPHFEFSVDVIQNPDEPSEVIWTKKLWNVSPDKWASSEFDDIFTGNFDTLELETTKTLDVSMVIDQIEDLESDEIAWSMMRPI
jgi:hypothetical protein